MTVYTIGHSTRSVEELIALLREAGVAALADVRSVPRSRTNPQFNADTLPAVLAEAGIAYRHMKGLGGLRRASRDGTSPNTMWRREGFRAYADYAMTPDFRAALQELQALARETPTAVMCAEAVWWRCHRRIIADYLLAGGWEVRHILGPSQMEAASLTPGAVVGGDGTLTYPAEQGSLL